MSVIAPVRNKRSQTSRNGAVEVTVILGGSSHERAVSLRSGRAIYEALKRKGLSVNCVDARNGYRQTLRKTRPMAAFIALHGTGGEDGAIQRVLDRMGVPYVGSSPASSLIAFDKLRSKKLFDAQGIPTPTWTLLTRRNWQKESERFTPPVFLKPLRDGSSIGVILAETRQALKKGIAKSFTQYSSVLLEQKIEGREFTVGILGGKALPVIELRPKRKFYDYKAKYTKGLTNYLVPAPIDSHFAGQLQRLAEKVHQTIGLRDFSRVDIMADAENRPYVLEANSIPGFTETSLLPKAAQAVGIDFDHLCLELLELACHRIGKGKQ